MTLSATTRTVTVPPTVGITTVSGVPGVVVDDEAPDGVEDVGEGEDDVLEAGTEVEVGGEGGEVEGSDSDVVKVGAAMLSGAPERSETRSSAAPTICHARVVATVKAASQALTRRHCLIGSIVPGPPPSAP